MKALSKLLHGCRFGSVGRERIYENGFVDEKMFIFHIVQVFNIASRISGGDANSTNSSFSTNSLPPSSSSSIIATSIPFAVRMPNPDSPRNQQGQIGRLGAGDGAVGSFVTPGGKKKRGSISSTVKVQLQHLLSFNAGLKLSICNICYCG